MTYLLHLLIYLEIYVLLVLGLNLAIGYCGLFSLAHSAFFAVGAYAYAILTTAFGLGFPTAALAAVVSGSVASLALSLPSWRLRGDFFLMISVATQVGIFSVIYNWYDLDAPLGSLRNLTNGPYGIPDVPGPRLLGLELPSTGGVALMGLVCVIGIGVAFRRLDQSPWGRMLRALRDDELALRNLGKNVRIVKAQVLAISSGSAAIAGTLYAAYAGYVDPTICSIDESVLLIAAVVIGGPASFSGALAGAALVVFIPEALRSLALPAALAANVRLAIFGLLMVLAIHFRPSGLFGRIRLT